MVEGNLYHRSDNKRECLTCKRERNRGARKREPGEDLGTATQRQRVARGQHVSSGGQADRQCSADTSNGDRKIGADDQDEEGESRECRSCERPLKELNGKWACVDISCSRYGIEVK